MPFSCLAPHLRTHATHAQTRSPPRCIPQGRLTCSPALLPADPLNTSPSSPTPAQQHLKRRDITGNLASHDDDVLPRLPALAPGQPHPDLL